MKNTNQKQHQKTLKSSGNKLSLDRSKNGVLISTSSLEQGLTTEGNHFPVLLTEVLTYLRPEEGDSYLDLTAGYAGHASAVLERTLQPNKAVLVDRDQFAVDYLHKQFVGSDIRIMHSDFLSAAKQLASEGTKFSLVLADLGVSSPHFDNSHRGFSVRLDGPLDMRMDQRQQLTAATIVNDYSQADLADIIRRYGEEPRANRIARLVVAHRPITSTLTLAQVVAKAWPGHSKHHPATRTFQALRIAVNDEIRLLEQSLPVWLQLLAPGGRIAVISFHSLEDRVVKRAFANEAGERYDASLKLLTKQPVVGSEEEIVSNPRARSAKLRAAVKINKKGE